MAAAEPARVDYLAAGAVTHVWLGGEQDGTTAALLERSLAPLLTPDCRVVIDLRDAAVVDSAVFSVILRAWWQTQQVGGSLAIVSTPGSATRRVLVLLKMPDAIAGYDQLDAAVNAVMGPPAAEAQVPRDYMGTWRSEPPGNDAA